MKPLIVIGGPTASGKTDLGRIVAEEYNGAVISVDSRQVYKDLDIGTGKDLTFKQYMIDVASPGEVYSVIDYVETARPIIDQLHDHDQVPVVVGGTGYYLDALIKDKQFLSVSNPELLADLNQLDTSELENRLRAQDPQSAIRVAKNRRRLLRALEIVETTGQPVPTQSQTFIYDVCLIILDPGKERLTEKIKQRLDERLEAGLVDEVLRLRDKGLSEWLYTLGLEYKFVSLYLDQVLSYEDMKTQLASAIIKYAGRQRTWWRQYSQAHWIEQPKQAFSIIDSFVKVSK
jgi:tRNA dimethylallyltransferase